MAKIKDTQSDAATPRNKLGETDKEASSRYFSTFWEKNRDAINERRREARKNDPVLAEKIRQQNRDTRKRASDTKGSDPELRRNEGQFRSAVIAGKTYFTIGAVASVVGCSRQAIRKWEDDGLIPKPELLPEDTTQNQRFYTIDQIEKIRQKMQSKVASKVIEELFVVRVVKYTDGSKKTEQLVRLGFIAHLSDRAVSTLVQYEQKGLIPETPLVKEGFVNVRYYTLAMVSAIVASLERYNECKDRRELPPQTLYDEIHEAWVKLHIFAEPPKKNTAQILEKD